MANEEKGGVGRLFRRARARGRALRNRESRFVYRETGGGYGGYGGTADRGHFDPSRGQFGSGFSDYGPRDDVGAPGRYYDVRGGAPLPTRRPLQRRPPQWYGGGVHETAPMPRRSEPHPLGGPQHGRFGREEPRWRDEGRGYGGPLGRYPSRTSHEQQRPFGTTWGGAGREVVPRGEAYAGRGHVGRDDYRDLERFGIGGADRGARRRYREAREERDRFDIP